MSAFVSKPTLMFPGAPLLVSPRSGVDVITEILMSWISNNHKNDWFIFQTKHFYTIIMNISKMN